MARKKKTQEFRIGQVVTYRGWAVRIKAFPTPGAAVIVPEPMWGAAWSVKTVAISELH